MLFLVKVKLLNLTNCQGRTFLISCRESGKEHWLRGREEDLLSDHNHKINKEVNMKKFVQVVTASALVLSLGVTGVMAEASAKATAAVSSINLINSTEDQSWTKILSNSIKTASQKDLFIDASLECGLYTDTTVKSKNSVKDTSTAEATVQVRVMIDGNEAAPGVVTFCKRKQELEAELQGVLELCTEEGSDTLELCVTDEETIRLMLETMNANSFNFIAADLSSGTHLIEVQARIGTTSASQLGSAAATAMIGKGSVTIEEVRMIKGEDIEL